MKRPILVLQYPNPEQGSATVALAATRDPKALQAFKEAVLEEARLEAMGWQDDKVLHIQNQMELEKLEKLLGLLIPDSENGDGCE